MIIGMQDQPNSRLREELRLVKGPSRWTTHPPHGFTAWRRQYSSGGSASPTRLVSFCTTTAERICSQLSKAKTRTPLIAGRSHFRSRDRWVWRGGDNGTDQPQPFTHLTSLTTRGRATLATRGRATLARFPAALLSPSAIERQQEAPLARSRRQRQAAAPVPVAVDGSPGRSSDPQGRPVGGRRVRQGANRQAADGR